MVEYIFVLSLLDKLIYFRIFQPILIDEEFLALLLPVQSALKDHTIGQVVPFELAQNTINPFSVIFLLLLLFVLLSFQTMAAFSDAVSEVFHQEGLHFTCVDLGGVGSLGVDGESE